MQYPIRPVAAFILALTCSFVPVPAQESASGKTGLPSLSYAELGRRVRSLEGKVVVVYFWSFG